ncbi:MAG: acyltransferase [Planctomycetaceae bacterium]
MARDAEYSPVGPVACDRDVAVFKPGDAECAAPFDPRYHSLDHWRGLAALAVLVFHATSSYRSYSSVHFPVMEATGLLEHGVQLFFVISGYCIAAAAEGAFRKSPTPCRVFAFRRVYRIFPPYLTWLAVMCIGGLMAEHLAPTFAGPKSFTISELTAANWVGNLLLTETWSSPMLGHEPLVVTRVGWTLCYEVQFYGICTLLMVAGRRNFLWGVAAVTLVATAILLIENFFGVSNMWRGTCFDGRWIQFAMGVAVYAVLVHGSQTSKTVVAAGMLLIVLIAVVHHWNLDPERWFDRRPKRVFELGICAGFSFLLLVLRRIDARICSVRALQPLANAGVISYSLYLVHWPVCLVLSRLIWDIGIHTVLGTVFVTVPVCFFVSLVPAWMLYAIVERPMLKGKLAFAYKPSRAQTYRS